MSHRRKLHSTTTLRYYPSLDRLAVSSQNFGESDRGHFISSRPSEHMDIFAETFSVLKEKLKETKYLSNKKDSSSLASSSSNERNYEKLIALRRLRSQYLQHRSQSLSTLENVENLLSDHHCLSTALCSQHQQYSLKQILLQSSIAERRLRELVYEILGEYGKSIIRAQRRQLHLRLSNRIDQIVSVNQMRWKFFIQRLFFEAFSSFHGTPLLSPSYSLLYPSQHHEEYAFLSSSLSRITSQVDVTSREDSSQITDSASTIVVCFVIKFDGNIKKSQSRPLTVSNRTSSRGTSSEETVSQHTTQASSIPYLVADTLQDMNHLISTLREVLSPPKELTNGNQGPRPRTVGMKSSNPTRPTSGGTSSRGISKSNSVQKITSSSILHSPGSSHLVSNHWIEWLKPCSYHTISPKILSLHFNSPPSVNPVNQFDEFTRQYVTQHMTNTYSQVLYFCLEERLLSGIAADDLILAPVTSGGGSGNTTPKSNHDIKVLQSLKYLQVLFASFLLSPLPLYLSLARFIMLLISSTPPPAPTTS
jgi:hypothetical protein